MILPPELQSYCIEPDIILVYKPSGISSFDVIRIMRRSLSIRKMGHAGTLDPLATGLMIIGIETGTKKLAGYLKLPKTYRATIQLGIATTSGDIQGEVMREQSNFEVPSETRIREVLENLVGEHDIIPPIYSALKVDGRALYEYARKGTCPIFMPIKHMGVVSATFLDYSQDVQGDWQIECILSVTSGTYIRSLAEAIGQRLGIPTTLSALERTHIAEYDIQQAWHIVDPRKITEKDYPR